MQYKCIIKVVRKFLKDIRVYSKLILKDVFKVCSKVTTDTSVQWLQYRTLHRIHPEKQYLKKKREK